MTIESATYISDLNSANPGASDLKSEGDDHIRLLKTTVKATFPNVTGAVTPTHTVINNLAAGTFPAVAITGPTRITATTGLVPGNSAQAGNVLDWYEEGTFVPTVIGLGTAGTGTYGTQLGTFTRIGNRVFFDLDVSWTATTGTGAMGFGGLPYAAATSNNGSVAWLATATTGTAPFNITPLVGTTTAQMFDVLGSSIPHSATGSMHVSGTYRV